MSTTKRGSHNPSPPAAAAEPPNEQRVRTLRLGDTVRLVVCVRSVVMPSGLEDHGGGVYRSRAGIAPCGRPIPWAVLVLGFV